MLSSRGSDRGWTIILPTTLVFTAVAYAAGLCYWESYYGAFRIDLGVANLKFERIVLPATPLWLYPYHALLTWSGLRSALEAQATGGFATVDGASAPEWAVKFDLWYGRLAWIALLGGLLFLWSPDVAGLLVSGIVAGVLLYLATRVPKSGTHLVLLAVAIFGYCAWAQHFGLVHAGELSTRLRPVRYKLIGQPESQEKQALLLSASGDQVVLIQPRTLETRLVHRTRFQFMDVSWVQRGQR